MPAFAVIVIIKAGAFLSAPAVFAGWIEKVAAIIRVAVRRSVVPVHVREPVVRAIVPIPTEADRPHGVRIDEVGDASSVPVI